MAKAGVREAPDRLIVLIGGQPDRSVSDNNRHCQSLQMMKRFHRKATGHCRRTVSVLSMGSPSRVVIDGGWEETRRRRRLQGVTLARRRAINANLARPAAAPSVSLKLGPFCPICPDDIQRLTYVRTTIALIDPDWAGQEATEQVAPPGSCPFPQSGRAVLDVARGWQI